VPADRFEERRAQLTATLLDVVGSVYAGQIGGRIAAAPDEPEAAAVE
jgi:hypothetical protein